MSSLDRIMAVTAAIGGLTVVVTVLALTYTTKAVIRATRNRRTWP